MDTHNTDFDRMLAEIEKALNPEGWREADGVKLPPITWAEQPKEAST